MAKGPVLEVQDLHTAYRLDGGRSWRAPARTVRAVDGVDLRLQAGEILALVGESGCGKTTLALTLMGLVPATSGTIRCGDIDVTRAERGARKALRRRIQMIFQDPFESLNPRMSVAEIVAEPLHIHGLAGRGSGAAERVAQALADAGLRPPHPFLARYPHELSGGQRQRVAIAAALVLEPSILLADEPASMLDVSIRAELLGLLDGLRRERGIAILLITHDLNTAAAYADRMAVMYLGRIVESGPMRAVLADPQHPYTRALLSVVPVANPRQRRPRVILEGETPDPVSIPAGCRFHPRCPLAIPECRRQDPPPVPLSPDHWAACLRVEPPQAEHRLAPNPKDGTHPPLDPA